jgi:hypothetical protein
MLAAIFRSLSIAIFRRFLAYDNQHSRPASLLSRRYEQTVISSIHRGFREIPQV